MTGRPGSASCPSCGAEARFPRRAAPLRTCRQCGVLLVLLPSGAASRAVAYQGGAPGPERLVALVCRLCGGPWSLSEEGSPASACAYCGHPASATPTVLSALRLLVRQPARLPSPLRRLAVFWLGAAAATLLAVALFFLRPPRGVGHREVLPLPAALVSSPEAVPLAVRTSVVAVGPRSRSYPYLSVAAPDLSSGRLCLLVRLTRVDGGGAASGWVALWDGEPSAPGHPSRHVFGELGLSTAGRALPLPSGDYRIELVSAVFQGTGPPREVIVELRTMAEPPVGFLVLLLNALPWLLVADLRASAGRLAGSAPAASRLARALGALVFALVLLELLRPIHPFGTKGALPGRPPGAPSAGACARPNGVGRAASDHPSLRGRSWKSKIPAEAELRITSKGQVTIPVEIRERLGLLPDTEVTFDVVGNAVRLRRAPGQGRRGEAVVARLRGRSRTRLTTDQILALTRG